MVTESNKVGAGKSGRKKKGEEQREHMVTQVKNNSRGGGTIGLHRTRKAKKM